MPYSPIIYQIHFIEENEENKLKQLLHKLRNVWLDN